MVWTLADFVTPFWRNALIAAGLVVAAYKYAPEPGKDVYLTRWIAMYTTPVGEWLKRSVSRAAAQEVEAENTRLMMSARRPLVHRYRYPQCVFCPDWDDVITDSSQVVRTGVAVCDRGRFAGAAG